MTTEATMNEGERFAVLLKAVELHQELTLAGELGEDAINNALWIIAEMVKPRCNGGCCG
jgi:hypothetical protein